MQEVDQRENNSGNNKGNSKGNNKDAQNQANIDTLARRSVLNSEPYITAPRVPGAIYLDANENPYGRRYSLTLEANRYPEPQPTTLINRYAKFLQVDPSEILVTLGGDTGIDLLIKAFCEPGQDRLLYCPPTFGMYQVTCDLYGVETVAVPLQDDFSLDLPAILTALSDQKIKMLFLCSPNNPTANKMNAPEMIQILEATRDRAIVVVDEAYIELSEAESFTQQLKDYPHLAIIRTLSKAFGLAGIRCGFVVANQPLIALLRRVMSPYPIPVPVIAMAEMALSDEGIAQMQQDRATILANKKVLIEALSACNEVIRIYSSDTNFLLVQLRDVTKAINALIDQRIFVRQQSSSRLNQCVRISVGLPEENEALVAVLAGLS
ncbi:histidinol-phosphate transaminase [Ignatzschineria ureiclastica]|uniref:Histidinol-phosphate aminotransferase n=2 Tax=Ignatzschineria ureiclastica TaxID=472582 RepID=A0A2U2AEP9_9GAMM|nr:histidinol-phosphate transaminase [Ignatzschineria ureiclastica]